MTCLKRHVEPQEGKLCLFCEDVPATWAYAALRDDLIWHWHVCDGCSHLIESDKLFPLVNRYVRSHHSQLTSDVLRPLVEFILREFKDHSVPAGVVH